MNEKQMNHDVAIAALRLSVIQPAFNGTFPDRNKQAYYIRIAGKPLKLPDGREAAIPRALSPAGNQITAGAASMPSCQNNALTKDTAAGWMRMSLPQSMN